jgi:hypothetical protein
MTDEELTAKLNDKLHNCPGCGSGADINQDGAPDGGRTMSMPMRCGDCGATWFEHYTFSGASDFEEG